MHRTFLGARGADRAFGLGGASIDRRQGQDVSKDPFMNLGTVSRVSEAGAQVLQALASGGESAAAPWFAYKGRPAAKPKAPKPAPETPPEAPKPPEPGKDSGAH
jgi:hypothetical protein